MRRQGKSYNAILKELKIPKSTLSGWFKDVDWSDRVKRELTLKNQEESRARLVELDKVRGANLAKAYEHARAEAAKEIEALKYNPLFIAGLMLYFGEGDTLTKQQVALSNSDPELIRLYVFFLRNACHIPERKIRAHILLYPDLDDWLCRSYWMKATGLSAGNFMKSTVIQGKHKTRRLSFGVCIISVSSSYLKAKVLEWIKLLPQELMKQEYYANIADSSESGT
ncbi:hypothetical protein KGQ55_03060 [Patescibacteria group bacterium]|nr:hypothetical protein [Patescibacteria group bacterium]